MNRMHLLAAAAASKRFNGAVNVPAATDPYWTNVSALMHFDNNLTDQKGNTWTAVGPAAPTATYSKFGGYSLQVSAVSNAHIWTPQSSAFDVGSGDWTLEFYYQYLSTPQAFSRMFQTRDGDTYAGISLTINDTSVVNRVKLDMSSNGTTFGMLSGATLGLMPIDSAFHHCALTRSGTTIRWFLDGVVGYTSGTVSGSVYYNASDRLVIGGQSGTSRSNGGAYDEWRFTKGVARYTTNFTPPTGPFPNS